MFGPPGTGKTLLAKAGCWISCLQGSLAVGIIRNSIRILSLYSLKYDAHRNPIQGLCLCPVCNLMFCALVREALFLVAVPHPSAELVFLFFPGLRLQTKHRKYLGIEWFIHIRSLDIDAFRSLPKA